VAVNQLNGHVLDWYNRQPVDSVATWEKFKYQLRVYFECKETITATLARISSQTWKSQYKKLVDFTKNKLKLMQFLKLSKKKGKNWAIGGQSLRLFFENLP